MANILPAWERSVPARPSAFRVISCISWLNILFFAILRSLPLLQALGAWPQRAVFMQTKVLKAMDLSCRALACWQLFEKPRVIPLGASRPIR